MASLAVLTATALAAGGASLGFALSSRLHAGATGACACGHTGEADEGFDLLPMALGQRCPACGSPSLPWWVLAGILVGTAYVLFVLFTLRYQALSASGGVDGLASAIGRDGAVGLRVLLEGLGLGCVLMAVAVDWRTQVLPEPLLLPGLWLVLLGAACGGGGALVAAVAGGAAGYLCFTMLSVIGRLLMGVDALGPGDARLAGIAGAWAGLAIGDAILIAGLAGLCMRAVSGRSTIALGPALAVGILVTGVWIGDWSLFLAIVP